MSSHLPQFPHDPSAVGHVSDAAYDAGHTDGRLVGKAERDALQAKLDRVRTWLESVRDTSIEWADMEGLDHDEHVVAAANRSTARHGLRILDGEDPA